MTRFPFFIAALSCLSLIGCGADDDKDTAGDTDTAVEDHGVQPQAGEWTVVTSGWANDDCNAEEGLEAPSSITFSDVDATSFSVTFYDQDVRIGDGSSRCTYAGDDVYDCEELDHGFTYTDVDATISMTAVLAVTVTSETTASGNGELVLTCAGTGCDVVASGTNSGSFPCGTTLNWTAETN